MRRNVIVLILVTLTSISLAAAGERSCDLRATALGFDVDAQGVARLIEDRSGESVELKLTAKVEDGTVLIVSVTTADGKKADIGSISVVLGAGEFLLNSAEVRFSPAFPVGEISSIAVRKGDSELLEGRCFEGDVKPSR